MRQGLLKQQQIAPIGRDAHDLPAFLPLAAHELGNVQCGTLNLFIHPQDRLRRRLYECLQPQVCLLFHTTPLHFLRRFPLCTIGFLRWHVA